MFAPDSVGRNRPLGQDPGQQFDHDGVPHPLVVGVDFLVTTQGDQAAALLFTLAKGRRCQNVFRLFRVRNYLPVLVDHPFARQFSSLLVGYLDFTAGHGRGRPVKHERVGTSREAKGKGV